MPRIAATPLLEWVDPSKAIPPGQLLSDLARSQRISIPKVHVHSGAAGVRASPVCFAYITAPCPDKDLHGCPIWIPDCRRTKQRKQCDRAHVDIADSSWRDAPKSTFQDLWDFLQHQVVAQYLRPTAEFKAMME